MPTLNFSKSKIPLWTGGNGALAVDTNVNDPSKPITPGAGALMKASFDISGNEKGSFGGANSGSVQLCFTDSTHVTLAPIWSGNDSAAPDLDQEFGISAGLDKDTVAMTLEVGNKADLSVQGSFGYKVLQVGAEVDAGSEGRYVCVRTYPATDSLQSILENFLQNLAMPGTLKQAPDKGALYTLELGGYLKLGINASAGYSIQGTGVTQFDKDFRLSDLTLSESYSLSVLGKLDLTAKIAGEFSVQVRAGAQPGWANVKVFRKSTRDLRVAADLQVGATGGVTQDGQALTGQEFLGALLGVNARNWLNQVNTVITEAGQITSGADLQQKLGDFASALVSKYAGREIGTIAAGTPELANLLKRLKTVVDSYQNLDSTAITLFDRYVDAATGKADDLLAAVKNISALKSLHDFGKNVQADIPPVLWNVFQQMTGGDPLTAILDNSISAVQKKVNDTMSLLEEQGNAAIRDFIKIAKGSFGIDPLFNEIAKFDSVAQLQQQASASARGLITRMIGKAFNDIPATALQKVLHTVKQICDKSADFWTQFNDALNEASSQSFNVELNAAWQRSNESTALIDVDINLLDPAGIPLIRAAGIGDFSQILAHYNPKLVVLNKGSLTHDLQSSSGVKINIVGWHLNFEYQNSFKVLTQTDQQIRPTAGGRLNVFTTIDMRAQQNQMRKTTKAEEQVKTNFTLQFLALTNNVIDGSKFDSRHKQYLIDVITGFGAAYNMSFTDSNTTEAQLKNALAFTKVLGLDAVGATIVGLKPVLQLDHDSYGFIDAEYRVMFTPEALQRVFAKPIDKATLRRILKPIILANYIGEPNTFSIGWMYVNDQVEELAEKDQFNFVQAGSILADANIQAVSPIPDVPVPEQQDEVFDTSANINNRNATVTLFHIEQSLFGAFSQMQKLVEKAAAGQPVNPADLADAVNKFGDTLNLFASMANGQNTTFAIMDGLIKLANPGEQVRSSALAVTTHADGAERHMLFQLQAASSAPPPNVAAAGGGSGSTA